MADNNDIPPIPLPPAAGGVPPIEPAPATPPAAPQPPAPPTPAPAPPAHPVAPEPLPPVAAPPRPDPYAPPTAYAAPAPGYQQAPHPGYGAQPGYAYQAAPAGPAQGLSLASLIIGIASVLLSFASLGLLPSIAAVILGHLGQRRQPYARPLWLTGLITGYIGLGISLIWLLFGLITVIVGLSSYNY